MKSWVLERQRRKGGKLLQYQAGLSEVKPSVLLMSMVPTAPEHHSLAVSLALNLEKHKLERILPFYPRTISSPHLPSPKDRSASGSKAPPSH